MGTSAHGSNPVARDPSSAIRCQRRNETPCSRGFYALGTGLGGVAAPYVFGKLIESGSRQSVFGGYVFAAALMFAASFVALRFAVPAERKPLEQVATPLSAL